MCLARFGMKQSAATRIVLLAKKVVYRSAGRAIRHKLCKVNPKVAEISDGPSEPNPLALSLYAASSVPPRPAR
jgi:hypothetical protein